MIGFLPIQSRARIGHRTREATDRGSLSMQPPDGDDLYFGPSSTPSENRCRRPTDVPETSISSCPEPTESIRERLLGRRLLLVYLQHLFNCFYLMVVVAVGFMFQLIKALSYVDRGKQHDNKHERMSKQNEIFMILINCLSVILLSWIVACLTMRKCDEDKVHGEGLNLFLRVGSIVFCIGAVILTILKGLSPLELYLLRHCTAATSSLETCDCCLTVVFYALQTYFLFKYHKTAFICGRRHCEKRYVVHAHLLRFAVIHLIGANLLQWLQSIIWEAMDLFHEANVHYNSTSTIMHAHNESKCNQSVIRATAANTAQPYLFPCIIEYSLIAATALIAMYIRVGRREWSRIEDKVSSSTTTTPPSVQPDQEQLLRHRQNDIVSTTSGRPSSFHISENKEHCDHNLTHTEPLNPHPKHIRNCEKSHIGFFLGLILLAIFIVYIACQFIFQSLLKNDHRLKATFSALWLFVYILGTLVVVILSVKLTLAFRVDFSYNVTMEKLLLFVTYFGNLVFIVTCLTADIDNWISARFHSSTVQTLNIAVNAMQLMQETLQSVFVLYGLNLRAVTNIQRNRKLGRTCLTVLIFVNIVVWLHESLLLKQVVVDDQYVHFYGLLAWCMMASTCYPLIIFFRFHSASLVAEMWSRAYD